MQPGIPLFPDSASTFAPQVDHLFFYLMGVSFFFASIICFGIIYFAIRYRRRSPGEIGEDIEGNNTLEIAWTVLPFMLLLVMFGWGTSIYIHERQAPDQALDVYVVGKQWMWKLQHSEGRKEINELHVPVGVAVKLTMTSEDVIHDFFVPAFRTKMDIIPGRYSTLWFRATKPGKYHFFCSQYCGTDHAVMGGWVYVMDAADYQAWLGGSSDRAGLTPVQAGEQLFTTLACVTCHSGTTEARGPNLHGVYGSTVHLNGGQTVLADDGYIRESILQPAAKVVEGYQPLMPTFQGLVTEEQLIDLIAYVRSLSAPAAAAAPAAAPASAPVPAQPHKVKTK
jgi:cytochrome c oxidase subunit 2